MAAIQPLCVLMGVNPEQLNREELIVLEVEILTRIFDAIKSALEYEYGEYKRLLKSNMEKEWVMIEENIARCVVNDILSTDEYSIEGIASYTQIPEEVIFEVASGLNDSPSLVFWRRIIDLHKTIRPKLYHGIVKKIVAEMSVEDEQC